MSVILEPPESDEALVQRAKGGDSGAMDALLAQYEGRIRTIAIPYFLPGADRQDLFQEARLGFVKAVRDYRPGNTLSFRYFADMCVRRNIITSIKKSTRQKHYALNYAQSLDKPRYENSDDGATLSETIADGTLSDHAQALVRQELTAEVRDAILAGVTNFEASVLLEYMRGFTYAHIAQRLGITPKSCDNAMQRVKKKITVRIQDVLIRYSDA